ncbi:helix-turn-helix domain-containing protein [Phycicoccus sp. BSK3Z-2]|uniref:Helix-turn-helix domain-containing protein n=1 Tax=Phycicoccus avicenniae TaxID=2828860 RepID=A0A941D990_9MICO|nr:helix-turn-helix domain-containing protein [Phycicoccus avicenniae]MBR7744444.1 helix-turn-helix domain-containing protein [Phycicoccus avicenniae]
MSSFPRLCYNASEIARMLNVPLEFVIICTRKTDDVNYPYPPILPIAGRHGYQGAFAITARELRLWERKLNEPQMTFLGPEEDWEGMKRRTVPRIALTLKEAAAAVGVSPKTLYAAVHAVDPRIYPPPLKAGRHGPGGNYSIRPADLEEWVKSLQRWA